jgi:hypothetical protein
VNDILDKVVAAKVVSVRPGDVIFLRVDTRNLTSHAATQIKERAQQVWPDNKIVVGDLDIDVAVVRPS